MTRNILAILSGAVTGLIVILITRVMIQGYFPFPETLEWTDKMDRNIYLSSLPTYGYWITIATHAIGAFLSGLIAALIARKSRFNVGIIAALITLVAVIIYIVRFQFPNWFYISDTVITLAIGALGAYIGGRRSV